MAKDPAFLFYPGDWQGGTSTMSRFIKGCYMDLLIAQFNSGPLSLEEIKTVLGSDFGPSWPTLQKKFKQASGLFFNERLEVEKTKRAEYSKSRRENRKGKTHVLDMNNISASHVSHMDIVNKNEVAIDVKEKGVPGEREKIFAAMISDELWLTEINRLHSKKNIPEAWIECFLHHTQQPHPPEAIWEWRQKLNTWLINKKEKNGTNNSRGTNATTSAQVAGTSYRGAKL